MARYEHLPIYKAALDAAVHFENVVAGFSRYHKYTLGTELRNASRLVVEQVIRANSARARLPELIRLLDGLERVLVLMRLAKEVKAFKSFQAYQHAAELVVTIRETPNKYQPIFLCYPVGMRSGTDGGRTEGE